MAKDTPKYIFEEKLVTKLKKHPDVVSDLKGIIEFNIDGPKGGTWTLDPKSKELIKAGSNGSANLVVSMSETDFVALMAGKLNPTMAFFAGKIKVKGDMQLIMKLSQILS